MKCESQCSKIALIGLSQSWHLEQWFGFAEDHPVSIYSVQPKTRKISLIKDITLVEKSVMFPMHCEGSDDDDEVKRVSENNQKNNNY